MKELTSSQGESLRPRVLKGGVPGEDGGPGGLGGGGHGGLGGGDAGHMGRWQGQRSVVQLATAAVPPL